MVSTVLLSPSLLATPYSLGGVKYAMTPFAFYLHFWVLEVDLVATPSDFYIVYILQKKGSVVKKGEVIARSSPSLERERHLIRDKKKTLEADSPYDSTPNNEDWSPQEGEWK